MKRIRLLCILMVLVSLLTACRLKNMCDHTFGEWEISRETTCSEAGERTRTCKTCGEVERDPIEKLAHIPVKDVAREATCMEHGLSEGSHCSVCKTVLESQKPLPLAAHDYRYTVDTHATCQSGGHRAGVCRLCEARIEEDYQLTELTATQVYQSAKKSIAEITVYNRSGEAFAYGSGFVYTSNGRIVTNYHVMEDAYSADVKVNGKTYAVELVLAYDTTVDLAILKIRAQDLITLPVCGVTHEVGETVYAFGCPQGFADTFSRGMITHANRLTTGVSHVQHDAAISPGNSGGPLLNRYGEVIGINTWTVEDSQNLNFAVSASVLLDLKYSTPLTMEQFYDRTH